MIEVRRAGAQPQAPTGDAQMGASGIEIRPKSRDPYYTSQRTIAEIAPAVQSIAPTPEMGLGDIVVEGAKGLARGGLGLAQSIGGTGVEMAGQLATGAYDALRSPQPFPGMTPEQWSEVQAAREAQAPTPNPLQGYGAQVADFYQADRPSLARDPRTSPENAPYLTTNWGVPQLARLAGEGGEMIPAAAATIGAAAATGGLGLAGVAAGGLTGGAIEGLSEYQQVLDKGGSPEEALRAASIMGAGSSALNAIPFVTYSTKFLPKSMQGAVARSMLSFLAEGSTESMEGGVSAAARMEKLPKSQEEWVTAFDKVKQGVIDESNVFLVAGLMGGGTAALAGGDPKAPSTTPVEPVAPTMSPSPAISQDPVDRLEPGPNAPTPTTAEPELFEDDFAPFDMPVAAPPAPQEDEYDFQALLDSLAKDNAVEAPVEQAPEQEPISEEMRAILAEYPEVAAMLNATRNLTPEQEALEQTILNADTIDSREIPKVEIRRPVSREESQANIIEARPVLDVGRPLDLVNRPEEEGIPQGPARATVRAQDRPRPGERPTSAVPSPEVRATVRAPQSKETPESRSIREIDSLVDSIAPAGDTFTRNGKNDLRSAIYDVLGVSPPSRPDPVTGALPDDDMDVRIGESILSRRKGGNLDSPVVVNRIAKAIARGEMDERGVDVDMAFGPESGLTQSQKGDILARSREKAESILAEIKQALSPEPKSKAVALADERRAQAEPVAETSIEERYAPAMDIVDGRKVRPDIPNLSSIDSSISNPRELSGVREVPMTAFTLDEAPLSKEKRTLALAEEIRQSGEINPLIVAIDEQGPYILEGSHRYDALKILGAKSFPAKVVVDEDAISQVAPAKQPALAAEFVGLQERPRGQAPIALYNIPDDKGGKTTVTAETAKERGFSVPEAPTTQVKTLADERRAGKRVKDRGLAPSRAELPAPKLSKPLQEEIDERVSQGESTPDQVLEDLYSQMDDPSTTAYDFRNELRRIGVATGGWREISQSEMDRIMVSGKGAKKYDFKIGNKFYVAADPAVDGDFDLPEMQPIEPEVLSSPKKRKPTDESGFGSLDLFKIPGRLLSLAKENAGPIEFKQGFGVAKSAVVKRRGKLKSLETRAILLQKDFENAYRTIFKRDNPLGKLTNRLQQVPDALQRDINTYLEEKDPDAKAAALEALPPEMRKPAVRGRQLVDDLTDYLISIGVVTDEQGVQFEEAKGSYLRRTYDAATDPDFKGKRDPRVVKMTRDWLKKEYPNYNDEEIKGIMTDLDGFGINEEATANLIKRGGVLGKLDRNTLGRREDIPEAIQEYWGVSRRGIDRVMDTVNSQAHIIANYEFLSELADTLDGTQVATAATLRDIKRGTYKGKNADEIMSWPYLNDADRIRSVKKHSRNKEVTAKQKGLDEAIARVEKLPDSVKKREALKQLKEDKAIQQRGLKRDKAGVLSVDENNLAAAADYIEQLTAQVSALRKGGDKTKEKRLRSELDKYTRQYNKAANEGATEAELPSMFGSFGPMAGARIHPDLKAALQEAMAQKDPGETGSFFQMINTQMKQNVTTRDPRSAARNFMSGVDFAFANGWVLYDTKNAAKRLLEAANIVSVDIKRNHDPAYREKYLRTTELGVTGDTAVVGDITATAKNAKKAKIARWLTANFPEAMTSAEKVDELATKIYQAGDDVFKVFGWLTETQYEQDANGSTKTKAEEDAAKTVRMQFPTYSEIPKWTQWLKRSPLVGPFVAYKTETYRNTWNIVAKATSEVKSDNPKVRRMGYRRLVGLAWAATNRKWYLLAIAAATGIGPDDDEAREMALPDWYKGHSIAYTDVDKAKGIHKGYNISTMDAFDVWKAPVFAALRGDDMTESVTQAAKEIGETYYSPEMGVNLASELLANYNGKSSSVWNSSDETWEKFGKGLLKSIEELAIPGAARMVKEATTSDRGPAGIAAGIAGFKSITANMPDSLYWMARDVAAVPREQSRDVYKKLRANDKAGAEAEIASANKTRKERFTDLHKAFTAFRKAGTNETLLNDAMKRAGLSAAMIDAVKYNQYEDWQGSETIQEAIGR